MIRVPLRASAVFRCVILGLGLAALVALSVTRMAADADARFQRSQSMVEAVADKAQAGLQELVDRFGRVTGGLRPQDIQGDTTALSVRLLRAEPQLAPASGLLVFNMRSRQVAGTSPVNPEEETLQAVLATAFAADPRGTVLVRNPSRTTSAGEGFILARRIEDGTRGAVGVVVSTLTKEAMQSVLGPTKSLAEFIDVRVSDVTGAEVLRIRPEIAGIDAAPSRLAASLEWLTPRDWRAQKNASAHFAVGGLDWSASIDAGRAGGVSHDMEYALACAVCALALLALTLWPARWFSVPAASGAGLLATDLLVAQEAVELMQRKLDEAGTQRNRVLAAIGHDVRTPINSILGISALLMDGDVDDGQRKWLHRIRASCDALLAMLNGMLEIAAASMDGAEVHREPVDVATLIEEIGEVLRPQAHDKGLEFQVRIEPSVLGAWQTDPTRLRQVLFNLIGNAIKYTARGCVDVHVSSTSATPGRHQGRDQLCFGVKDTGPGIAESEREQVFEQFRRGHAAVAGGQEGLGLGLALCREIATLLGGRLSLSSEVSVGSTFTFEIPAERIVADAVSGAPLAGRTALVIGLSDGVRRRTASHLERMGFEVETAADGFIALGLAERTNFHHGCLDLILVDAVMTGLPADTLLTRLQAGPNGERLRTIVVANGPVSAAIEERADTIVPHPVEAQSIERALIALFGTSSVLQEMDPRAAPPAPLRVLVVEDNRINQLLFVDVLSRAGFSAFAASSGEEAVDAAVRGGFDVILMDVQMPGIDGVEAARRIRAAEHGYRTPIVGLTAHTGAGVRKLCFDAQMDSVLHKPVDLSRLPLRLREAVFTARSGAATAQRKEGQGCKLDPAELDIADEYIKILIAEVGIERARSCMEDFLNQMSSTLPRLNQLVASDLTSLAHLAHNMAGVAGTMGVIGLLDGLLLVEDAARQGDPARVTIALQEVSQTWDRVHRVLRLHFDGVSLGDPDIKRAA